MTESFNINVFVHFQSENPGQDLQLLPPKRSFTEVSYPTPICAIWQSCSVAGGFIFYFKKTPNNYLPRCNLFSPISFIKKSHLIACFGPLAIQWRYYQCFKGLWRYPFLINFLQRQPEVLTLEDLGLTERVAKILRKVCTRKKTSNLEKSQIFDSHSTKKSKFNTWHKVLNMFILALQSRSGPNCVSEPDFQSSFLVVRVLFYHEH